MIQVIKYLYRYQNVRYFGIEYFYEESEISILGDHMIFVYIVHVLQMQTLKNGIFQLLLYYN